MSIEAIGKRCQVGRVVEHTGRLLVHTEQVYFNCPKYIQQRALTAREADGVQLPNIISTGKLVGQSRHFLGRNACCSLKLPVLLRVMLATLFMVNSLNIHGTIQRDLC